MCINRKEVDGWMDGGVDYHSLDIGNGSGGADGIIQSIESAPSSRTLNFVDNSTGGDSKKLHNHNSKAYTHTYGLFSMGRLRQGYRMLCYCVEVATERRDAKTMHITYVYVLVSCVCMCVCEAIYFSFFSLSDSGFAYH